jgi:hypothetical protein
MMQKKLIVLLALAVPLAGVALSAIGYAASRPSGNQLEDALRSFGYLPLRLPSSEMTVGAIYRIDSKVRFFDVVCDADPADLAGAVKRSSGGDWQSDALSSRQFNTGVQIDLGWLLKGDAAANQKQNVHFSFTDIVEETISYEKSQQLLKSMAERPSCGQAIVDAVNSGGYVCQGLKLLEATTEYKLDQDTMRKLGTSATTKADVNSIVKLAVEQQSGNEVVERQGKVQSGKKLKYAVAMKPICMAPTTGRFQRALPESTFGRMTNFVLFNLVEPIWPGAEETTREATGPLHTAASE